MDLLQPLTTKHELMHIQYYSSTAIFGLGDFLHEAKQCIEGREVPLNDLNPSNFSIW